MYWVHLRIACCHNLLVWTKLRCPHIFLAKTSTHSYVELHTTLEVLDRLKYYIPQVLFSIFVVIKSRTLNWHHMVYILGWERVKIHENVTLKHIYLIQSIIYRRTRGPFWSCVHVYSASWLIVQLGVNNIQLKWKFDLFLKHIGSDVWSHKPEWFQIQTRMCSQRSNS